MASDEEYLLWNQIFPEPTASTWVHTNSKGGNIVSNNMNCLDVVTTTSGLFSNINNITNSKKSINNDTQ